MTSCSSSRCTIFSDAATCCKPIATAAKCNSISDTTDFCQHYGSNGLIEYAAKSFCASFTCTPASDGNTCCKPAPPSPCTSIANPATFCANHGNNGLAYGAATLFCETATCDVLADASTCCKPAGNATTCDSISDVTSFCLNYGNNGLINGAASVHCATATCLITANDAIKCCKPAPPAL